MTLLVPRNGYFWDDGTGRDVRTGRTGTSRCPGYPDSSPAPYRWDRVTVGLGRIVSLRL